MTQDYLFQPIESHRLEQFSKTELFKFIEVQEKVIASLHRRIQEQMAKAEEFKQRSLFVEDQYIVLKHQVYGKSSEREPVRSAPSDGDKPKRSKKIKIQLPSERYPNAPLVERHVELQDLPSCTCCGTQMSDSGMTEDSEHVTVIPAKYMVVRVKRHKYCCDKCHGAIKTAPTPKRITPGSAYSDEMAVDVSLSKYCDLIPIERYARMADRGGMPGLPPQSLIECTHHLADFLEDAYRKLKSEVLNEKVLHADETPHRMLEGDEKSHWFLWGFSSKKTSYFEIRDTRSGDVASELLKRSKCEFLVSDVFSGYGRAVRETNEDRISQGLPKVLNVYCNAHARRRFKIAKDRHGVEAQYFIEKYQDIYKLEEELRDKPPQEAQLLRKQMAPIFNEMRDRAMELLPAYSTKSTLAKAMNYFFENYTELTLFTKNVDLPIDNNPQERLLRNPVIGRKTWYGTHSKRGALTTAMLFSLVESCKLNKVNPRIYFKRLVEDLHAGKSAYTPYEFKSFSFEQ